MRRIVTFTLVFALVLSLASAAAARERRTPGPLSAVSIAGTEIGYSDGYRPDCHEIRLWDVATRADRRLASHCFVGTSTGSGVSGVIATGGRALWITYTGGNIREWSLWTKGGNGRAKRLAFLPADVDGPAPVVLGRVWDGSLPYATGRTIVVLAPNGSRRFSLTAADRVVSLSAHSRGYAAVLANGTVLSISLGGNVIRERTFPVGTVEEAVIAAPGLVVKTTAGLEIHGGDGRIRSIPLPRGSRFLGLSEGTVAYGIGQQLRLLRLVGGKDTLFHTLAPRFQAQLGRRGLAYASGRTLGYDAWVVVAAASRQS